MGEERIDRWMEGAEAFRPLQKVTGVKAQQEFRLGEPLLLDEVGEVFARFPLDEAA